MGFSQVTPVFRRDPNKSLECHKTLLNSTAYSFKTNTRYLREQRRLLIRQEISIQLTKQGTDRKSNTFVRNRYDRCFKNYATPPSPAGYTYTILYIFIKIAEATISYVPKEYQTAKALLTKGMEP